MEMILELTKTIFSASILLFVACASGSFFAGFTRSIEDRILRGAIHACLGLGILSYYVVFLDLLHVLRPIAIWILLAILFFISFSRMKEVLDWLKNIWGDLQPRSSFSGKLFFVLFLVSFLALLAGTLSPEIGGDSLVYHLNLAKVFLREHSLTPNYFDLNSYLPLFMNNLYLIGLATGGVFTAKAFSFFCAFLLFLLLKRTVALETGDKNLSYFTSLVLWLTPTLYNISSTTYVDGSLALFSFASFILFLAATRNSDLKLFLMSGLLLGFAMSIKYLAMISAFALLGIFIMVRACREPDDFSTPRQKTALRSKTISAFLWMLGFSLGCGYWIGRNWIFTGNPIYPYLASFFHTQSYPGFHFESWGMGKGIGKFFIVFWNMFAHPEKFGSLSSRTGLFYAVFYPISFLAALRIQKARPYFVAMIIFLIGWFFTCQAHRYVLPILPVLIVNASIGIDSFYRSPRRTGKMFLSVFGILILTAYFVGGIFHYRYAYYLYLGRWTPVEYLKNLERSYTPAEWANKNLPLDAKILMESEVRQFYFDRPIIRNNFLEFRTHYQEKKMGEAALRDFYKSLGITHYLVCHEMTPSAAQTVSLPLPSFFEKIYSALSENIRDEKYFYEIYQLK